MSFGFGFALPAYPLRGGGGNNPFNQLGPTLDLSFIGTAGDLSGADTYTLNTDFITPEYQVAAQYAVWENGVGLAQKTFSQIVTFTRASTATYFNSAGTLTSAAVDEARFDYSPSTLAPLGFLIEESRTNSIRNNTMVGAVAGTPGTLPTNWSVASAAGLTTNVIGTGTSGGVTYIDLQITGTTTGTSYILVPEAATQIAALNGQAWTSSAWWSVVAGNFTNVTAYFFDIRELDSGGVQLGAGGISVSAPTSTFTRISASRTTSNASTAFVQPRFRFTVTNSAAVDFTLRIGLPQLEQGAFATSVIPTTTTALTRSADVASVNTLSPWFNAAEGTLFAEYNIPVAVQNQNAAALTDGTNNNRMIIRAANSSTQTVFIGVDTSVSQWIAALAAAPLNATTKSSFAYATNDIAWVRNAGTVGIDTTATIPTVNQLKLGADGDGTSRLSGWLRRVTYYPRKLSSAELQAITT